MYKIGEVAKLMSVSTRVLRHYDKISLATPNGVLENSDQRIYNDDDIKKIKTILSLKELGFSLSDIGVAIGAKLTNEIDFKNAPKYTRSEIVNVLNSKINLCSKLIEEIDKN
jgi:DNA-binding transcriptional MerR regulator